MSTLYALITARAGPGRTRLRRGGRSLAAERGGRRSQAAQDALCCVRLLERRADTSPPAHGEAVPGWQLTANTASSVSEGFQYFGWPYPSTEPGACY